MKFDLIGKEIGQLVFHLQFKPVILDIDQNYDVLNMYLVSLEIGRHLWLRHQSGKQK